MVAVTLVPVEDANGLRLESEQVIPVGDPTMAHVRATFPVKPLMPLTRMASVMLLPTLVETLAVLAVMVKSCTPRVTLFERVTLAPAAKPLMATVALPPGVVPKVVCSVTTDWFP